MYLVKIITIIGTIGSIFISNQDLYAVGNNVKVNIPSSPAALLANLETAGAEITSNNKVQAAPVVPPPIIGTQQKVETSPPPPSIPSIIEEKEEAKPEVFTKLKNLMPKNEKQDEPKFMEIKEDGDLGFNFGDETESKGEKHKKNDQLAILNEELEQAIKEKNYTKMSLLKKKIKTYSIEKRFKLDYSKNTNIDYPQEVINQKGNDHLPAQDDAEYYKSYIYNAISKNDKYNLEILMNFMKNNDIKDHHGNNLVMKATMMNNNIIVKELVNKYGISPNKSNYYGATPLHVAAFNGNADLVKFFLNNNGDVQKTDDAGNSPVDYAKKKNNQQIVQLLSYRQ